MRTTSLLKKLTHHQIWGVVAILLLAALIDAPSAGAGVIENGLIGYWAGDGNANDSSSTHNDGLFLGNANYVPGVRGQAFNLNFGAAFVTIPDNPLYTFGPAVTVAFWMYGQVQGSVFVGQDNGPGFSEKWFVALGYPSVGFYDFHINHPGGPPQYIGPQVTIPLSDGWNHLAFVKDGEDFLFYANGQFDGQVTVPGVTMADPTANLQFGIVEQCCQYTGPLDEVTIHSRALSAEEVAILADVPEPAGASLFIVAILAIIALRAIRPSTE